MDKIDIDYLYKLISIIMVTETIERSAFVFTHSKFPNDWWNGCCIVIIKKSTKCPYKILNKLNSRSPVPGKWQLDYIMFDINFTKIKLTEFIENQGAIVDNDCYNVSKHEMIRYLHEINNELQVPVNSNNTNQEFVAIYGIGLIPVASPNHLSA